MIRTAMMKEPRWAWALLIAIGLLRLTSLGAYPLADTTEARYGNIARLMLESGDWITPQFTSDIPFWGKPPLSFWLSAGSMKILGVNEFAARIPSFLIATTVIALVWLLASSQRNSGQALASVLMLATSALFFVSSGAVMTDTSLLLGTTLCMVSFWLAYTMTGFAGQCWGYAFFIGLAIGLLAKGPVAVVLTALPIGTWTLFWKNKPFPVWKKLPWFSGIVLTAVLCVPWYCLAEIKTPGFIDYFLIGEHWKRFTVPGWQGDLYGNAHLQPKGTIWLYWLGCALPWSLILPAQMLKRKCRCRLAGLVSREDGWIIYVTVWAAAPMVCFTLASNIMSTYVLPALPASSLLAAELMAIGAQRRDDVFHIFRPIRWGSWAMLLLLTLVLTGMALGHGPAQKSQQDIIASWRTNRTGEDGALIYLFNRPHSADFYSRGTAVLAPGVIDAEGFFQNHTIDYFVVRSRDLKRLPHSFRNRVTMLAQVHRYYLMLEHAPASISATDTTNRG